MTFYDFSNLDDVQGTPNQQLKFELSKFVHLDFDEEVHLCTRFGNDQATRPDDDGQRSRVYWPQPPKTLPRQVPQA